MRVEINAKQYGVSGDACSLCDKVTKHLYKHESFPNLAPCCARCMDKLPEVVSGYKGIAIQRVIMGNGARRYIVDHPDFTGRKFPTITDAEDATNGDPHHEVMI